MIKLKSGLFISGNSKTGFSMNFSLSTCRPTPLCKKICYARFRNTEEAKALGSTANTGPITWDTQQLAYNRNTWLLDDALRKDRDDAFAGKEAMKLWAIADEMAEKLHAKAGSSIRWNGQGDLSFASVSLIAKLAANGIHVWGFTRKAHELEVLSDLVCCMSIPADSKPYFQVSIDASTRDEDIQNLIRASHLLNGSGKHVALAVVAGKPKHSPQLSFDGLLARAWIRDLPFAEHIRTVFGYHTSFGHTIIGVDSECPATRGEAIVCWQCRRCWGREP